MSQSQWYWLSKSLYVFLVWLLFGSQTLKAQDDVLLKFKSHRIVKVCGEESNKRVQVSLSIGEVKSNDSLYSFDIIIAYDTNKVKIMNALTINTLAEYFEYKGLGIVEPGYFRLYAAQMLGPQVSGNKPLIAFEAKLKDECADSIEFNLDYAEIEVSQNLQNKLNYDSAFIKIPIQINETSTSYVEPIIIPDTLSKFGDDSLASVIVNLNTNDLERVNFLRLVIEMPKNDNLILSNFNYLNDKIEFINTISENDNDKTLYKIDMLLNEKINNESILEIFFKRLLNRDDELKVNMYLDSINDCSCATSLKNDSFVLKSLKDTIINVIDEKENKFNKIDYLFVTNDVLKLKYDYKVDGLEVYNLNGQIVLKNRLNKNDINISALSNGIYMIYIFNENKILKKIVMIKN